MSKTQSEILNDILNEISSSYNKTEGEFIWDLSNAVAKSISNNYKKLEENLAKNFVETASGKDLDTLIVQRIGKARKESSYASGKVKIAGSVGTTIQVGMLVANNTNTYVVQETAVIPEIGYISVTVKCQNPGVTGNTEKNTIVFFPKTIEGLTSVTNESAFTNGYNAETDEDYKKRYFDYVSSPTTSGNKYHYRNWAMEVIGVGNCTVIPEPGNVKVVIVDVNNKVATPELVEAVTQNIEENRPLLAGTLTVVSATKLEITISANVRFNIESYSKEQVKKNIENEITKYLKDNYGNEFVSYAKIGYCLFSAEGVQDYSDLLVNGDTQNVDVSNLQVAELGGVTIE